MRTKFLPVAGLLILVGIESSSVLQGADLSGANHPPLDPARPLIGTLESDPSRIAATNAAGIRAVVVGISWDQFEPQEGVFDPTYLKSVRDKIDAFRSGGKLIVLDLGVQYPPQWIFSYASSHFQNQYGEPFNPEMGSGDCGVNLVFSQEMREKFGLYVKRLFNDLGSDFYAIRLGGGRYGELGYPNVTYKDRVNCYWAFDAIAQGAKTRFAAWAKALSCCRLDAG